MSGAGTSLHCLTSQVGAGYNSRAYSEPSGFYQLFEMLKIFYPSIGKKFSLNPVNLRNISPTYI